MDTAVQAGSLQTGNTSSPVQSLHSNQAIRLQFYKFTIQFPFRHLARTTPRSDSLLLRVANRLILRPSNGPVDPELRRREMIETPNGVVEAWVTTLHCLHGTNVSNANISNRTNPPTPTIIGIKFPGTAGRAERGGPHPLELFENEHFENGYAEIWTVNPIGYGGSEGKACMRTISVTCDCVWDHLANRYRGIPLVVIGNSLGCLSALYLAARRNVAGVYLRNPVVLPHMIARRLRYNWWNFGLARWIAAQVPEVLDTYQNSAAATAPLLLVTSENDRVVPPKFQNAIFEKYGGRKDQFVLREASHESSVSPAQAKEYANAVKVFASWIRTAAN